MPGMMNTILNLGLNDETVEGLAKNSGNPRFAYDCYRRFIQMFGEVALDIEMEKFDHIFDARKQKAKAKLDTDLTADDLKAIIADYKKLVQKETGKPFPQDAREQLAMSRDAVFRSWWNQEPPTTAAWKRSRTTSAPPPTSRPWCSATWATTSATGVGFTRDPATGEKVFYGEFLVNAQGEDVVAGIRTPQPISDLEKVDAGRLPRSFAKSPPSLEKHYRDMQDFEFTIEDGKLYMLQTRNGKRTGPAAVRIAVEMVEEGMIDKKEAVLRVAPQQLDQLLHPVFDPRRSRRSPSWPTGMSASPGAAVGTRRLSPPRKPWKWPQDGPVILVRKETTPDDIHGMDVRQGHSDGGRRKVQPRGRGGARHGPSLRRRRGRHRRSTSTRSSSP